MFNVAEFFDDVFAAGAETVESISESLDFGFGDDFEMDVVSSTTSDREVDLTEVERANETNLNFPDVLTSKPVMIGGGILLAFVALKIAKII